ncbi:uncharacterized protein BJX67DRAFT_237705 [Aspergillus lucknowensis]|uniref:G-patch domain-containing protein n=1 Tax=Aspergillus lucknowensis TaxID=176173 RepID=A0ABR4LJX7_9EURO
MDAYAYLIRHGWSGTGNPLNPDRAGGARGGLGLTKPLLVARRQGNSGVGNRTTKDPTNQWWLRGFEDALKGVGNGSGNGNTDGSTAPKANALTSELYRFFVRGEVVPGTLGGHSGIGNTIEEEKKGSRKRKRDDGGESREERRRRKEDKKRKKAEKETSRERKREKKENKRAKKAQGEKRDSEEDYPTPVSMDLDLTGDGPDGRLFLDMEKLEKLRKKEKKKDKDRKRDKSSNKDRRKSKRREGSSSDERSKRKSKQSKTT